MGEYSNMTVGDLRAELNGLDDDVPVRLATSPGWPFETLVSQVVVRDLGDGHTIAYLAEGNQVNYLAGEVSDELGWRRSQ